jgi:subtilisin-like proprotein convertase family protein
MKYSILFIVACFCILNANAQTFTKTINKSIPNTSSITDSIAVSSLTASINSSFGLQDVMVNITHGNIVDLSIYLISPNGTKIPLSIQNGVNGNNYQSTHFNYNLGNTAIYFAAAPFNGNYQPEGWLGTFNNSQNPNGKWVLQIDDCCFPTSGTLVNWSLTFSNTPAPTLDDSTHLPIIEIFTNGQTIVDEPKIPAQMKVIDNKTGTLNYYNSTPTFQGNIGIEYRGSTSQTFPQKPYAVQTWDALGNNLDTSLLGMPSEHDWIFYAPYNDKSLMRNVLIYNISNQMKHYASRTKFFDLYVDGMYQGIYVLMEKIKRDKHRVDITKMDSTSITSATITGGYIFKIDKTTGLQNDGWSGTNMLCDTPSLTYESMYYQYAYPEQDDIVNQQKNWIQNYVTQFENSFKNYSVYDTLHGYKSFISTKSFVDHSMMVELSRNIDGYRLSSYYHKDINSKDAKLKAGPIWDYNLSFGNGDYLQATDCNVWQWSLVCPGNPVWWQLMYERDSVYRQDYKCRYTNWRKTVLSWQNIEHMIDSFEHIVHYDLNKNFKRWPILGQYTWPNAYYPPTYAQEIDTLKNWIKNRLVWMDSQLLDTTCAPFPQPNFVINQTLNSNSISIFPNPNKDGKFYIQSNAIINEFTNVKVYNITGALIFDQNFNESKPKIEINLTTNNLAKGLYLIHIQNKITNTTKKILLE